jgi:hypothetical protein
MTLSSLLAVHSMIGMDYPDMEKDYPQLQLQEPEKKTTIIFGELSISEKQKQVYYPASWGQKYIVSSGIEVSQYDPCIGVKIKINDINWRNNLQKQKKNTRFLDRPLIPAKYLLNLSTNSVFECILYGDLIKLTCKKNPLIDKNEFHQQFDMRMKNFYTDPEAWANKQRPAEMDLIPAGIVVKIKYAPDTIIQSPSGTTITREHCIYQHGPNGCPDEFALAKLATGKKLFLHNNSVHRWVTHRQFGLKPRPKLSSDPDRILDNCLRVMEFEAMADNNLLDECFGELQANCLLTRLFINDRIAKLFITFLKKTDNKL